MDGAFGWLGNLMEFIGQFFPRLLIVKKTHGGVSFVRGKHPKEVAPGLVVYWPLWTEVIIIPVVRQSLNLPSQTLTTRDKIPVTISAVIIYKVSNVLRALTLQWDLDDTIQDIALAAVRNFVANSTFGKLHKEDGASLKAEVSTKVRKYGVSVQDAWITDLAVTKVVTIVQPLGGDGVYADTL